MTGESRGGGGGEGERERERGGGGGRGRGGGGGGPRGSHLPAAASWRAEMRSLAVGRVGGGSRDSRREPSLRIASRRMVTRDGRQATTRVGPIGTPRDTPTRGRARTHESTGFCEFCSDFTRIPREIWAFFGDVSREFLLFLSHCHTPTHRCQARSAASGYHLALGLICW